MLTENEIQLLQNLDGILLETDILRHAVGKYVSDRHGVLPESIIWSDLIYDHKPVWFCIGEFKYGLCIISHTAGKNTIVSKLHLCNSHGPIDYITTLINNREIISMLNAKNNKEEKPSFAHPNLIENNGLSFCKGDHIDFTIPIPLKEGSYNHKQSYVVYDVSNKNLHLVDTKNYKHHIVEYFGINNFTTHSLDSPEINNVYRYKRFSIRRVASIRSQKNSTLSPDYEWHYAIAQQRYMLT